MHIVPIAPDIDPTLAIRDGDIRRIFPPNTFTAGRSYEQRGRVQDLEIGERGAVITATTQGTRPDPYVQSLKISHSPTNGIRIAGACSCPVGRGCKHLAAVLIAAQRKEMQAPRHQQSLFPKTPAPAVLPTQIQSWLADFDKDEDEEPTEDYPAAIRTRVFYVLDAAPLSGSVPQLRIDPMTVTLRKDNSPGTIKRYAPHQIQTPAKYIRPSDLLILTRLARRNNYGGPPPDDDPADTLRRILATGRARWGNAEGPALTLGPQRQGQITWITKPDASQQAALALDEGLTGVRIPEPWYADPAAGTMGPVSLDLPQRTVTRLLNAPSIPPEAAAEVRARLSKRMPAAKMPVPAELQPPEPVREPMHPHLRLISGTLPSDPSHGRGSSSVLGRGLYAVPLVRLSYQYGPIVLPRSAKPLPRITVRDGNLYEVERDRAAEAKALADLTGLGFGSVHEVVPVYYQHAHTDDFALREYGPNPTWLQIVTEEVPRLRADGWTVEIDEDFPVQVLSADDDIAAELVEGSGIDWLELHLGVTVDGQQVDLVPALVRLIAKPEAAGLIEGPDDKPFVLPLLDGRMLSLPMSRIRPTLQALLELWAGGGIDADTGKIGFSRLDAADLAGLEERTGLVWSGGDALRDLGRGLRQSGGIPKAVVPDTFLATLRPYQSQGVDWLQFLGSAGLGGVLADDMGLGKTVQTLAHLMIEKAAGRLDRPSLILCPTSLIPNWLAEARRFAPELSVLALHGSARKASFKAIPKHDLVLSTYPLLTRDADVLLAQEWHAVILDEAQSIKNPNAETTRQALRLKARQRLCLSGTPLQNHLGELWSLFDFLAPGFLGSQKSFKSRYRTPIEKHGDVERQDLLNRRIRPFMLRRTKEEVVTELPPKTEIVEPVEMENNQRAVYEAIRLSMHAKVQAAIASKGLARSGIIILDALLKMRQACCDPRLLKLKTVAKSKAGSAKLDRLMEMLSIMFAEGRRVLLFSQFTEMLALIQERLEEDGIEFVKLTGDTKDRSTPVKKFQAGDVPLFLISLKAGGVGLNLTAADTVIHYDPWWNPAVEDQATDRAHRIGQTKKVFVHRLVTLGTIEEKMEILKDKKRAIVASVMDAEHGGALSLTEADIEDLFAPAE
ncbi:MAG TPA: serine/threonine protein phosphatase [Acetobacteraceae bacterium]|jgi:superfamily II DNA or RNA helicase|nr:serine/threonine protein phosphatase [Acetobacteraceae bacterium]